MSMNNSKTYNQSDVDDIMHQIEEFLNSDYRNKWLVNDAIKIYVRKSMRYLSNSLQKTCFDFATISATQQGTGLFTAIITQFQQTYPERTIFIESVLTQRFADYIQHTLGFTKSTMHENNFYKIGHVANE